MQKTIKVALEISTSEVRIVAISVLDEPILIGFHVLKNQGMGRGLITNTSEVLECLNNCIEIFQDTYKIKITNVISSYPAVTINGLVKVARIENLISTISDSKLNLSQVFTKNELSANSVLSELEKQQGVLVIDIGAGTTSYTVVIKNNILKASTMPLGGELVTSDMALSLRTSMEAAEKIKIEFSNNSNSKIQYISVPSLNGLPDRKLNIELFPQLIEPRFTEIFELIKNDLKEIDPYKTHIKSIVLTGGCSLTPSIENICMDVFAYKTRVGNPIWGLTTPDELLSPKMSVLAGMCMKFRDLNGISTST